LLPESIAWRTKEAFSDGVSPKGDSWFQIIQRMLPKEVVSKFNIDHHVKFNQPMTPEQYYYRTIFDEAYPGAANVVPYFWMPKFVKAVDCSARTLAIYAQ
jgi:asparagine synthase (glutamine-hydrolysing)